jgi:hypothetical protein
MGAVLETESRMRGSFPHHRRDAAADHCRGSDETITVLRLGDHWSNDHTQQSASVYHAQNTPDSPDPRQMCSASGPGSGKIRVRLATFSMNTAGAIRTKRRFAGDSH